ALVTRSTGKTPRVAEVAPRDTVLQQDAEVGIQGQQTRRPEPSPVPLAGGRDHPRITGIARAVRAPRFAGARGDDGHESTLAHQRGRTGPCYRLRRSRTRMLMTIGDPSKPNSSRRRRWMYRR